MDNTRIQEIHFIRELLVSDYRGQFSAVMQISTDNTASVHPRFKEAPFYEQADVRALYYELGGGRNEGAAMGTTVVLPHRTRWQNLWRITAEEAHVLPVPLIPE